MKYKKTKVIIDTDPGVDDTAGLTFAVYDKRSTFVENFSVPAFFLESIQRNPY